MDARGQESTSVRNCGTDAPSRSHSCSARQLVNILSNRAGGEAKRLWRGHKALRLAEGRPL